MLIALLKHLPLKRVGLLKKGWNQRRRKRHPDPHLVLMKMRKTSEMFKLNLLKDK